MNDLHTAYRVLGLEPGTAFEAIRRRYRRLALVWHPDRMPNADGKREAEEELKKINGNFDKLKKHFDGEHKSGPSCRCQPAAAGPAPKSTSGRTDSERKRQEDETARRRTEERQRKMAEEESDRKAAEASRCANEKEKAAEDAHKNETLRKDEALRWKCAACIVLTFIALIAYCWVGCAARDISHAIGKGWQDLQERLSPQRAMPSQNQPIPNPYVERYNQIPGGARRPGDTLDDLKLLLTQSRAATVLALP